MSATDTIQTERLLLRRMTHADTAAMHAILSDPEVMQFWSTLPHLTLAETEAWVEKGVQAAQNDTSDDFVVTHNGAVVGKAGLWEGAELGMLFARSTWGTGIAAEAVAAVIERARERGVMAIVADVDPRNVRALKFLERFGFIRTHEAKNTFKLGDVWADSVYLSLLLITP
jgi:RimJ/RimL family protein N-acetyltransferase